MLAEVLIHGWKKRVGYLRQTPTYTDKRKNSIAAVYFGAIILYRF